MIRVIDEELELVNDDEFVLYRLMRDALDNPKGVLMDRSEHDGTWIVMYEKMHPAQAIAECLRLQKPIKRMRVFTADEITRVAWGEVVW